MLPRIDLGSGPTPVRSLWGRVWVKDDGAYGRYGGNKARKLELLLADAQAKERTTVLTSGALATNHGLATALYARDLAMRTILVLVPQPVDGHVREMLGANSRKRRRAPLRRDAEGRGRPERPAPGAPPGAR